MSPLTHKGQFGRYYGDRKDYVRDVQGDADASGDALVRAKAVDLVADAASDADVKSAAKKIIENGA